MSLEKPYRVKQPYELDYSELLRQAFYDCIVSLNSPISEQIGIQGISEFHQVIAYERFNGCVSILENLILNEMKDDPYKTAYDKIASDFQKRHEDEDETEEKVSPDYLALFHEIAELLNRQGVLKQVRMPHATIRA